MKAVRRSDGTDRQLALAEERGARRVREQVRALVDDGRRVVRVGEQQVEVVEASAFDDLLAEDD